MFAVDVEKVSKHMIYCFKSCQKETVLETCRDCDTTIIMIKHR